MNRTGAVLLSGLAACLGIASLLWLFSVHDTPSLARPPVPPTTDPATRGAAAFEGAGFGGISLAAADSHAMPWHLLSAALILEARRQDPSLTADTQTLNAILASFGFLVEATPRNRPAAIKAGSSDLPFGFTYGDLAPLWGLKVRVANLGCSACHAGVTYDATGNPDPRSIWLGMPNTSLDLEAYTLAAFNGFKIAAAEPDAFWDIVEALHPDLALREYLTLKFAVWPLVRDRLSALEGETRPLPFPNGLPGSTNGVAALKQATGMDLGVTSKSDNGIVSIPDLGHRHWRTSLLSDGAYALPSHAAGKATRSSDIDQVHLDGLATITTFFTVPSMGVAPSEAMSHRQDARDIFAFLSDVYSPMRFPGDVRLDQAEKGARVFGEECAACHGSYDWNDGRPRLQTYPNWSGEVETDPLRAENFTASLAERVDQTVYEPHMIVASTGVYTAPPLTGLWASAPYLHNGSVPTLHHLLNPGSRPDRFYVGGHALDFRKVGLRLQENGAFPEAYRPFARPVLYDTTLPGQGNGGHTAGMHLSDDDKTLLLEFLKLL